MTSHALTWDDCHDVDTASIRTNASIAVRYHFGMLLGVDDFETEQAYHHTKARIHQSWLHGAGVVWGLLVSVHDDTGEVRVSPGLACDGEGRNLLLDRELCLNIDRWLEEHTGEIEEHAGTGDTVNLEAEIWMRFESCLSRAVPAISEPCGGDDITTAYSRVSERAHLEMRVRGVPDSESPPIYPRLRLLFGQRAALEPPDPGADRDAEVLEALEELAILPRAEQALAWQEALHRFAVDDSVELVPQTGAGVYAASDPAGLRIAVVTPIKARKIDGAWVYQGGASVHMEMRSTLLPTALLQELLAASRLDSALPDGVAPRMSPADVSVGSQEIRLVATRDLAEFSVQAAAFEVAVFETGTGWRAIAVDTASYDVPTREVTLALAEAVDGLPLRLVARGTGPSPIVDAALVPLAGSTLEPPSSGDHGRDFVFTRRT